MAIIVVPKFSKDAIAKMIKDRHRRISNAILLMLQRTGEEFVKNARERASFKDQTGNLRSSIGYVILKDGKQLFQNFEVVGQAGSKGPKAAQKVVRVSKKKFPKGYVLIGVAGMEYAAAVESLGYDVITTSAIIAEQAIVVRIKTIQDKVGKMA